MPTARDWDEIRRTIPVDEEQSALYRRIIEADLRLAEMRLGELRRQRGISQAIVADGLDVTQPNITRIEQVQDIRLSTLGRYIAALGGRLEVHAVFDDGTVDLIPDPKPPPRRR
jgi:DNA-binding Xre family transcriptional regulator